MIPEFFIFLVRGASPSQTPFIKLVVLPLPARRDTGRLSHLLLHLVAPHLPPSSSPSWRLAPLPGLLLASPLLLSTSLLASKLSQSVLQSSLSSLICFSLGKPGKKEDQEKLSDNGLLPIRQLGSHACVLLLQHLLLTLRQAASPSQSLSVSLPLPLSLPLLAFSRTRSTPWSHTPLATWHKMFT